jgi:hypothetical protein
MALEGNVQTYPGLKASADLSAKQFRCMKLSGAGTFTVCAAVTDKVIGILQDTPTSGQPGSVAFAGLTKVKAGGTIAAGDTVGTDGNGAIVAYVEGTDTTKYRVGIARSAGASGDFVDVLLQLTGRLA